MHLRRLISKLTGADFALAAFVSLVLIACVGVFLLPLKIQDKLKVYHPEFNPIVSITASFVHFDLQHLTVNLLSFVVFAPLLYILNRRVGRQGFYFYFVFAAFIVLPLMNYGVLFFSRIFQDFQFACGLSLVDSALIGFTLPSLVYFLKATLKSFNSELFFLSLFLLTSCLVVAPFATGILYGLPLLASVVAFALLVGQSPLRRIIKFAGEAYKQKEKISDLILVVFTLYFYFFSVWNLFPANIVIREGSIVDILSHFIGLAYGIIPLSIYNLWRA